MADPLDAWMHFNKPGDTMYWKEAAMQQFEAFKRLADQLGVTESCSVAGDHTSKSIRLPVVEIPGAHGRFLLRDNFHGMNLCFQWEFAPDIDLSQCYGSMTWDDYLAVMKKKRESGMCYGHWTDEEMDDPRILRVQVTRDNGSTYWSKVSPEEKDRWLNRMTSTEWYTRDWSSGKIIVVGTMGPGCKMYVAGHAFAEGISRIVSGDALKCWEPGMKEGIFALGDANGALAVMQMINKAEAAP